MPILVTVRHDEQDFDVTVPLLYDPVTQEIVVLKDEVQHTQLHEKVAIAAKEHIEKSRNTLRGTSLAGEVDWAKIKSLSGLAKRPSKES